MGNLSQHLSLLLRGWLRVHKLLNNLFNNLCTTGSLGYQIVFLNNLVNRWMFFENNINEYFFSWNTHFLPGTRNVTPDIFCFTTCILVVEWDINLTHFKQLFDLVKNLKYEIMVQRKSENFLVAHLLFSMFTLNESFFCISMELANFSREFLLELYSNDNFLLTI